MNWEEGNEELFNMSVDDESVVVMLVGKSEEEEEGVMMLVVGVPKGHNRSS